MAKSGVFKRGAAEMTVNMTPMIDCVFQLLIFFMLTTQVASQDFVKMNVPNPKVSQARKPEEGNRVVVNVVPYPDSEIKGDESKRGLAKGYQFKSIFLPSGSRGSVEKLARELDKLRRASEEPEKFIVELRADENIHYREIEPVLQALQQAELVKMFITAKEPRG